MINSVKKLEILETSKSVLEKLKSSKIGQVHSVYKNTINLTIGEKLISIHPKFTIKTPMSIRIAEKEIEHLNISTGEKVIILEDKFLIGGYTFDFRRVKTWDPNIEYLDIEGIEMDKIQLVLDTMSFYGNENSLKDIGQHIINPNSPTSLIEEGDYFTKKAFSIITDLYKSIMDKKPIDSLNTIVGLIGLGQGLTPSGDDFLSGLLSVFILAGAKSQRCLEISEGLKEIIRNNLKNTTFLSEEFFHYAIKGEYSEIFHDLYKDLKEGQVDNIRASVIKFIQVGSSSGMDTLAGILIGMYIVKEIAVSQNRLPS